MIFTVSQLCSSSYKFINSFNNTGAKNSEIKYYIEYYGKLSHAKIRNLKQGGLNGEYLSLESEFIKHCIMQYDLFKDLDKEIACAYKCLIAGASHIIKINEKIFKSAIKEAEEFLSKEL